MSSPPTTPMIRYLGRSASDLLGDKPFASWPFERSVETELEEPEVYYVFDGHGLRLTCDSQEVVRSIFIHQDFDTTLVELPFDLTRGDLLRTYGQPAKSGEALKDPILGEYGGWDRYHLDNYFVHFQFEPGENSVSMITLMLDTFAP